jgi:hypothetical protein
MQYSSVISGLKEKFEQKKLLRPRHINRYDEGEIISYKMQMLDCKATADVTIQIEKFVGGGFAGQVYKVKILSSGSSLLTLENYYAIKILIPPSKGAKFFRDILYWIGFQAPFQLQVNPAASRAGAIWQKFIRRAAKKTFGCETAVVDIYATFVDENLGSCGEISEWIEGRTWQLEVDEHLDYLKLWQRGKLKSHPKLGSVEYRTKKLFMKNFVKLLNNMGAYEFARQYEWSTCKSQPNCLKRLYTKPDEGLTAVDFRAGLTLLPFLPMSPGDIKLIIKGIFRGSVVQFDRGSLKKLKNYLHDDPELFGDMQPLFEELTNLEGIYRNSILDITHNLGKIFSKKLWNQILCSSITGWRIKKLIDEDRKTFLAEHKLLTLLFYLVGMIPFLGRLIIKLSGNRSWRKHIFKVISGWRYLQKAFQGKALESIIIWLRCGRITSEKAVQISENILLFWFHSGLSVLPKSLHRFLSDRIFFKEKLWLIFVRPIRLYFDPQLRNVWLRSMLTEGKKKRILSEEDANLIDRQLSEPFIQKYLKSLAVHVCTIPITQVVSVLLAMFYILSHPEMPRAQAWGVGVGIIALFQVIPISPGSLIRGLYVLILVIKERDFKNYNIAVFLSFFKYIGYLAFPIQMTYKYPALARFMAVHWATDAVHIIPVFGEQGALLEHWVFRIFYNLPLTLRRQMRERQAFRRTQRSFYFHYPLFILIFAAVFGLIDYFNVLKDIPPYSIKDQMVWGILLPGIMGFFITEFARGIQVGKMIFLAVISGLSVSVLSIFISFYFGFQEHLVAEFIWRFFIISLFSLFGTFISEISSRSPVLKQELG